MTLAIVIIVGILGTLLLGYMAYRNWASSVYTQRRPTQAPTPSTQPVSVNHGRWSRKWLWWSAAIILLVAVGVYGRYGHYRTPPSPATSGVSSDNTFTVVVRPGQPAEVVMPPDWQIVWWGDTSRFESHAIWLGKDKIRVFTTRPGVGSAEIKIHRYHDPDPNWWRRQ